MSRQARFRHSAGQTTGTHSRRRPEAEFQSQVIELATLCRWRHYHPHNSERSVPGFPDLTLVRGSRIVFAELKAPDGRVTPEQQAWWLALTTVSQAVSEASGLLPLSKTPSLSAHLPTPVIDRHGSPAVGAYIWRPDDWDEIQEVLR